MTALKTNFLLKTVKGNEKPVLLMLNFGYKEYDTLKDKTIYKPLKYYTGVKVLSEEWNKHLKLPFNKAKLKELLSIEQTAKDVFAYLSLNKETVTPDLLKNELDIKLKGKQENKQVIRLTEYIREIILKTDTSRSESTLKQYKRLANKIDDFEERKNVKLSANTLDEKLYLEFMNDMRNQLGRINSVWSINKTLKAVLNEISRKYKMNVFKPSTQLAKADRVSAVNEDKIYLNYHQIQKILDYDAPSERLKNTQLILTTLLFTGCRFSDVFKIKPEFTYIKNETSFRYTRFISTKTSTEIVIPILKPLENAYEANEGNLPYIISPAKFNEYVKELVKNCGLKEEISLTYTNSMGKKEFEVKELYEFISSHVGRRSFITNLINYVPITILTKITGHTLKDRNIIFGYNKISLLDNAVLFVKELKRITNEYGEEFPIELV